MSDATEAIVDIIEAIDEYGSGITLNIITKGEYDVIEGESADSITAVTTKALPKNYTSQELQNTDIHTTDIKFMLYYDGEISYKDNIVFDGKTYNLLNIDKKIFQDETIIYTIQGRV